MEGRTPYQEKIIKRYYENKSEIMTEKLHALVTDLYLADTPKKRDRVWERIALALRNMNVPEDRIAALRERNDAAAFAKFVDSHSKF